MRFAFPATYCMIGGPPPELSRIFSFEGENMNHWTVRMLLHRALAISLIIFVAPLIVSPDIAQAVSTNIVVSQVYGGGGNSGATLKNDFIELFNRGNTTINVTGWSVQYASASGTSWSKTDLSGSIPPGGYYLVQEAAGTGGSVNLPTPDATGNIAMSATAGKVALVSNTTLLAGSCPSGGAVVDLVGYGSANCFEGSGPTALLSNTTAAVRAAGGCTDTDINSADFSVVAPNPRNSASAANPCGTSTDPTGVGAANPSTVAPGGLTVLSVTITPGNNPPSTGLAVTADLSGIGGAAAQSFFDDGTNGDVTAGDNVFSFQATVSSVTTEGAKSLPVTITDAQLRTGSTSIPLTVQSSTSVGSIVISQVYGGGGNSGAVFKNDFIELYNKGTSAVNLSGWSVQYTSAGGSSWQFTTLSGSIASGQYYLVQEAAGSGGTVNLPAPDKTGNIALSASAGKVALVSNATALAGSCPSGSGIIDFVGYGSSATCFEGAGAAPAPGNTTAVLRAQEGCTDTGNNVADFFVGAPKPRNSASPLNVCGSGEPPPTLSLHSIQGSGSSSPFSGQVVETSLAIVTALKSNGFFIQEPDASVDADANTSEGLFVFTSSAPPAAAAIGNAVTVTGTVSEFRPATDPSSPTLTELSFSPSVTLISTGNTLPTPIPLTAADTSPAGSIEQLERYEGMRVTINSLVAIAPTDGNVSEVNATATSNGVFFAVITGVARPFREPGVEVPNSLPAGSPANVPRFDANPERLRVDSDGQTGAIRLEVTAGAVISNVTGVVDYSFRTYTILPDPSPSPVVTGNVTAVAVPAPNQDEFTIGSFNLERFFDTINDPLIGEPVLTTAAFANRLNKASLAIRNIMQAPDILGVVEMENKAALEALANKINNDTVAAGRPNPAYVAYLEEGNDVGGIDSGFLVKSSRITVRSLTQEGKDATYVNPETGVPETLNDRPPLVLRASLYPSGDPACDLTVIVNHLRSFLDIEDPADGNRVRTKRRAQAEFLANLVQARQAANPSEPIVLVGDFNAFEFNDGLVDSLGTIKGTPTPADQVVLASGDLVNPSLSNLVEVVPANERYSYSFNGNAQVLDHILVNDPILPRVTRIHYARNNADYPESMRGDSTRPERISDHDMPVAYFSLDAIAPVTSASIAEAINANGWYTSDVHITLNAADNAGGTGVRQIQYTLSGATTGGGNVAGSTASLTIVNEGTTTLTFKAVDCSGNIEGVHTLTIKLDKNAPKLTCPENQTAQATSGSGAVVHYPAAIATDAVSTPTVTYSKASGTVFPLGVTTVTVTATDPAGHSSTCSFVVTVLGPRSDKRGILNDLIALRATVTDEQDGKKLDQAIDHLSRSLEPSLWVDESHLEPKHGDRVFSEEKDVVAKLQDLQEDKKSPLSDALLQGFIDRIVRVDRLLANIAIDDAVAAGGDAKSISRAREELAEGDARADSGKYSNAIEHYRKAWSHTQKGS